MNELVSLQSIPTGQLLGEALRRATHATALAARRAALPLVALLPATLLLLGNWALGIEFERDAATAGLLVGTLVGLTGMGSGALMTPVLIVVVGVPPVTAVGTDLTYAALTKLVGGWQHARQGTVDATVVRNLATGSVPAALAGVALLTWLQHHVATDTLDGAIKRGLGVVLTVSAGALLFGVLRSRRSPSIPRRGDFPARRAIAIGAVVGFLVGMTSVGSGSLVVAALSLASPLPAATIVGTDVVHAAILTGVAGLVHGALGNVDLTLALSLLAGSLPGVVLGSSISPKLPATVLRLGLVAVLLFSALALF